MLALTATASPPVRQEIVDRLRLDDPVQVVRGFDRPNLHLEVQTFRDDDQRREAVVMRAMGEAKPGLVYTATRKSAERYAEALAELGIDAAAYHAGRKASDREDVHTRFLAGDLDVVVATTAFGMGIDKADVRFVLHAEVADSLDSYYQEVGRAGRDGEPAEAVLFYRQEDLGLRRFFASGGVDEQGLKKVVTLVNHAGEAVEPTELAEEMDLSQTRLAGLVNLLEQAGALQVRDSGDIAVSDDDLSPQQAADAAAEVAESHRKVEQSRVEMMRAYAETTGCRTAVPARVLRRDARGALRPLRHLRGRHGAGAGRRRRLAVPAAVDRDPRELGQRGRDALRGRPDRRAVRGGRLPHAVARGGRGARAAGGVVTDRLEVDVVVVGGGVAGLAAASWIGRYRRSVVVVDGQDQRNKQVEVSHGYLGRDPQSPADLLARGREEVLAYPTASLRGGEVKRVERRDDGLFEVDDDLLAHRVLLACGVKDAFPDVEGFFEHYGASVFHCPACDGYEARDRHVVALGWDPHLVGFAATLQNWACSVTVVTNGMRFQRRRQLPRAARRRTRSRCSSRTPSASSASAATCRASSSATAGSCRRRW